LADSETRITTYLGNANNGEVVKALDQFYDDPANAAIPIALALPLFVKKLSGASAAELTERTAALRKIAHDAEKAAKEK
jgi:hypothetical protein